MIEIELNKIVKNYGFKNILKEFSMEVKTGEKVALIGQNGSGKSTILKIIAKEENVDSGLVNIRHGAKIGMLKQIYENVDKSVLVKDYLKESFKEIEALEEKLRDIEFKLSEEVDEVKMNSLIKEYGKIQDKYISLGGYDINEKLNKIYTKFYISEEMLNQNYNDLSGGEKTRINLAKLILTEPDILLLDEPTNHLDIESLEFLEDFLIKYKGTILIVSHDRYFLDKVITKTILLENGKENVYNGNYSYFLKEDERRTLAQFENYKNQQRQIEKMKESIIKLRQFGDLAKNEMFFKRAKSIEKRLEKMDVIDKVELDKKSIDLNFKMNDRSGKDVIKIENISKRFENKAIFKEASVLLGFGEKIALIGKNGAGKSTLIKMIMDKDNDYEGNIIINPSVKIGYIPQNIQFENNSQSVLEYLISGNNLSEGQARNILARYGFRGDEVFKKVGTLSGGEKVRTILIHLIQEDINLLILDEPTNHIDIDTREILEESLKNYKGTILFVTHDRYFMNTLATSIWSIEDYKIKSYYGNYDSYSKIKNNRRS